MIKVALLGCTGSIGETALRVLQRYSSEYRIVLLANYSKRDILCKIGAERNVSTLYSQGFFVKYGIEYPYDENFLSYPETYRDVDVVINGISGFAGVGPSIAAVTAGKILALANKESVVCAGDLLRTIAKKTGAEIRPIDSEHSALWQCLDGRKDVEKLYITCSGGAFRDYTAEQLRVAKAADALKHPTWRMGDKITVDCATLVNKGLEIIEAKKLFGIDDVQALYHRESIVHGLIGLKDGSIIASLAYPDMEIPVQYALTYPRRLQTTVKKLNLNEIGALSFGKIDEERFPCFTL